MKRFDFIKAAGPPPAGRGQKLWPPSKWVVVDSNFHLTQPKSFAKLNPLPPAGWGWGGSHVIGTYFSYRAGGLGRT